MPEGTGTGVGITFSSTAGKRCSAVGIDAIFGWRDSAPGPTPIAAVRELPMVKRVEYDEDRRDLVVYFDRGTIDAETVIGHVLWALLNNQARISGVTKGKGLEQRVMELT